MARQSISKVKTITRPPRPAEPDDLPPPMLTVHRKVTVGVCGGIAAYKAVELVRLLQDAGYDPHVVMTRAAEEFLRPLTFAAISGHPVITSLWGEQAGTGSGESHESGLHSSIEHIEQAQTTRLLIVAPATADILAKFAHGLADDFLSTLYLATSAPVLIAPAMNVVMWQHPAVQANVATLRARGVTVIEPGSGYLACGMTGGGRLAEPEQIVAAARTALRPPGTATSLRNETVLVTAGGTREAIDPVRFIGNRSSGRMGYAIAAAAQRRGARVLLISAPTGLPCPAGVELIPVVSADEMRAAVLDRLPEANIVIMAAAVSDYRVAKAATRKIKRETNTALTLGLIATEDILREAVARRREGTLIIGFAAETDNPIPNALAKLTLKGIDAIVVNDVSQPGIGFEGEDNAGSFLHANGVAHWPVMPKHEMAERILDNILKLRSQPHHAI